MWGSDDALVSSVYAEEFAKRIKGARIEILDGCGHVPQLERREETLALVGEFLGSASSRRPGGRGAAREASSRTPCGTRG